MTLVQLKCHKWRLDLLDFERHIKTSAPWSAEKTHLMTLVAAMACASHLPIDVRSRASQVIRENIDDPIVDEEKQCTFGE